MIHRPALIFAATVLLAAACGGDADNTDATDTIASTTPSSSEAVPGSATTADDTTTEDKTSDDTTGDNTTTTSSSVEEDSLATTPTTLKTPSSTAPDDSDAPASTEPVENSGGIPITGGGPIDTSLQPFIDQAVADLAASESIAPTEITVESAQLVQWNDGSAGCPQPGMQYTQALTDGSAIQLTVGGTSYWYHTGGQFAAPTRCDSPSRQPPSVNS